jgi:mono/diheme cytochrome c family protein
MPPAVPRKATIHHPRALQVLALLAALLPLAGCGGADNPDLAKGKQLFTQRCGSCHALADANTRGTLGPDLDDSFRQAIADGLGRSTVEGVVNEQIAFPQGGQMPANLVTGADREAVAAYVADVAGKRSTGTTTPGGDGPSGTAKANDKNEVEIPADATGQLAFEFKDATANAGGVTLLSKNDSQVPHDISIKGRGVDEQGNQVTGGGTSKVTVDLKPGTYTFYCSVPGHEQGGMKGTLTVK